MVRKTPYIFAVFTAIFLLSCSPANRLSRLLARHPNLKQSETVDTFYSVLPGFVDTFKVQKTDTFTRNDTTFIRTSDTIRFERKCPTIRKTIYVQSPPFKDTTQKRQRPVYKAKVKPTRETLGQRIDRWFTYIFIFCAGYMVASVLNRFTRR